MEGVKQLKNTDLSPLLVFVMPPSIKELERRLTGRNTESAENLKKRLDAASSEIEFGKGFYTGAAELDQLVAAMILSRSNSREL